MSEAKRLVSRLRCLGRTWRAIARDVGVTERAVQQWAAGERRPRPEHVAALRRIAQEAKR